MLLKSKVDSTVLTPSPQSAVLPVQRFKNMLHVESIPKVVYFGMSSESSPAKRTKGIPSQNCDRQRTLGDNVVEI